MEVSKADLGLEDATEVGTDSGSIRAAIEDLSYGILPAYCCSSEGFLFCFLLAR